MYDYEGQIAKTRQFGNNSFGNQRKRMGEGGRLGWNSSAIDSSNIGFQLLKKSGWKEGTGLGVAEQGRLEPLQPHVKKNKRGLGAEKIKQNTLKLHDDPASSEKDENDQGQFKKKPKGPSKRIRKMQEEDKRMQDKEFERAFFREFWPDNV
ncbi:D111/G-patch domain-containing protein [Tasmannia lanceolata]|uniref:D111/G-patch domain-containing protein n=1 Tax=Tasmannia lanceolata TaxID=3420 RepID=UPI004064A9E9